MDINSFFKSVIDSDIAPVVICDLEHTVVYMNPASISRYHADITGKNIKSCHNTESGAKIDRVVAWFKESKDNNIVFTSRNDKENKDVYMVALRDDTGTLIGYYEKHEYRNKETNQLYDFDNEINNQNRAMIIEENIYLFYDDQFSKEAKKHISNKEYIFHYIIEKCAWKDATIRERYNRDSEIIKNKELIIEFLEKELSNNVAGICSDYHKWHNKICTLNIFGMRYGVWQKFINMTFKYLYCVRDIFPEFNEIWKECHCPIDTVIAKQIHKKLLEMNIKTSELMLSDKISKSDSKINWNYICQKDYATIQEQVKQICNKENIYPIEFDFLYWKK